MKITLSLPNSANETEEVKAWFRHAEALMAAEIDAATHNLLVYGVHRGPYCGPGGSATSSEGGHEAGK